MPRQNVTNPNRKKKNQPRVPDEEWGKHRPTFFRLYERMSLQEVVEMARRELDFPATERQFTNQFNKHGVYKNRSSGDSRNNKRLLCAADFHQAVSDGRQAFPIYWRQLCQCTIPKLFLDMLVNCARTCERGDEVAQISEYINGRIDELKDRGREDDILFCHFLYILQGYICRRVGYRPQDMYHTQDTRDTIDGLISQTTSNEQPPKTYSKIIDMPRFMLINFGLDEYSNLMRTGNRGLREGEIFGKDWRERMMQTLLHNQQPPKGEKSQFLRILPNCLAWCIKKLERPVEIGVPSEILTAGNHNKPTWKATIYVFCFLWGCCFYDLQVPGNHCSWARHVLQGFGIATSEFLMTMTSMILTTVSRSHAGDAPVSTDSAALEEATRTSPRALLTFAHDAAVALEEDLLDPFVDEYVYLTYPSPAPVTSEERRYMDEIFQYTREFIGRFPLPDDLGYEQESSHANMMVDDATGYDIMN